MVTVFTVCLKAFSSDWDLQAFQRVFTKKQIDNTNLVSTHAFEVFGQKSFQFFPLTVQLVCSLSHTSLVGCHGG